MGIHQIQLRHDQHEDRLLLRVTSTGGDEFRFWLTRRFVDRLWGLLMKMLEWDEALRQQFDEEARRNVLEIRHEGYAQQGDFETKFAGAPHLPLGESPVLLAQAKGNKGDEGTYLVSLLPQKGQGIDMALDAKLLHIFIRLLREVVEKAGWGMDLRLYQQGGPQVPAAAGVSRKLN
jgi:hypothetical protein